MGKSKVIGTKICPVCGIEFDLFHLSPGRKEKQTCSTGCANTLLRTGKDHPNWKDSSYRSTCFLYHKKKCIVCGEMNIVQVHHFDENKENNSPENLIPLCPTHHQYWHSRFKKLIEKKVIKYQKDFSKKFGN